MMFYIYDENLNKIGTKKRKSVHFDGDWHKGIQLNIICGDEILIQQRSHSVDIAKGCYDQSLAVQLIVEDGEDDLTALKRGLKEELGIENLKIKKVFGPVKIKKTYDYDSRLNNNEFITLYEARLKEKIIINPTSDKVSRIFWRNIEDVKKDCFKRPDSYTKTFSKWLMNVM